MTDVFSTKTGPIVVQTPDYVELQDVADFIEWLEIFNRKFQRAMEAQARGGEQR